MNIKIQTHDHLMQSKGEYVGTGTGISLSKIY